MKKEYITQDILQECWFLLKYFESEEYVSNKLKENHLNIREKTVKRVSKLISNYIKQAKELYSAYENTSYLTSPLLLYYAFNDIAKAYILYVDPKITLDGSHGLEIKGDDVSKMHLADTKIMINNKGTFVQFEKLINDKFTSDHKISIDELFSNMPELKDVYKISYNKQPNLFVARKKLDASFDSYKIEFEDIKPDIKLIDEIVKKYHGNIDFFKSYGKDCGVLNRSIVATDFDNIFVTDLNGNKYFSYGVEYSNGFDKIHNLITYYLLLYTYSMYVRYYPNSWQQYLNSQESGVICKSIEISKYRFLVDITKLFIGDDFKFSSSIENIQKPENISELTDKILKEIKHKQFISNGHALDGII